MQRKLTLAIRRAAIAVALWSAGMGSVALGQSYYVAPSPAPADLGYYPTGVGQMESINPIAGNLALSFPLAQLPPGPGGFSTGVRLLYNSAYYTSGTTFNGSTVTIHYENYPPDVDFGGPQFDGGWRYGFRYAVWSASEPAGVSPGKTTYLTTADGAHHVLLLAGTLNTSGTAGPPPSAFNNNYPNQPIYEVDFRGWCTSGTSACISGKFSGTLIFATADGTQIRVEVDTVNKLWSASFPDGTVVSGNYDPAGSNMGEIAAAEWNQIHDKNGNTISLTNFCYEGDTCTTALTDQQGRAINIRYGTQNNWPFTWTDTITQPGVNGTLSTIVNWASYDFTRPTYECSYNVSSQTFGTCDATGTFSDPFVVTSIQLPQANSGGASTVYQFAYDSPPSSVNWGLLHSMSQRTLASGSDLTPCANNVESACPKRYQIDYQYSFDNPSTHRVMGTLVNPVSSRTLTYAGGPVNGEVTSYSIPVPLTFDPQNPPAGGGTSTITNPDN
ncbi:MAG: hypothetical protein ACM336_14880, partial [Acidobacteriota bacterium]